MDQYFLLQDNFLKHFVMTQKSFEEIRFRFEMIIKL